jgi:MarR family transcriptional regulator, organic hydroperoxide resistance regulator
MVDRSINVISFISMDTSKSLREEIKQGRPFRGPAEEATIAILRTADVVRRKLSEVIEPKGITLQQYNVLRILRGSHPDPLPTLEIGERLIEQAPGITRLLDRLESKGLVQRERSGQDRRLVLTRIRTSGLALLAELDDVVDQADRQAIGTLDPEEIAQLTAILQRVRRA